MRFLIQRVNKAKVEVDGETVGSIGKGFLVLIGISGTDNTAVADKMIKKLTGLRIFEDENGKTNLDLKAVGGQLLLISQFTLYADCRRGNRPSFTDAGAPDKAEQLYHYIIEGCRREIEVVEEGRFGAEMKVSLVNNGPFTVFLDSAEICH
ncbi:MAG: D-tyrosyl-tRNA(Tyr) deacylase [Lachnospiraceae bacterium]|jgi:D-tyrosyl-tRNA(Tyr) deacylase|nr:D-tyrosyl-tRNA(Tyr) deacylase [Lachnospiraceae bacterium]